MVTEYCTPCIYCRSCGAVPACHYYLDVGNKLPCPTGDGCTARVILPPEERREYIQRHSELRRYRKPDRDWHLDDYIVDTRGIVGEYYDRDKRGR